MTEEICSVCLSIMSAKFHNWHYSCPTCKYERAVFVPTINLPKAHQAIDEKARELALRNVRKHNFHFLLMRLLELKSQGSLLDVGCAHGWFLELARVHFKVLGLEPDRAIYDAHATNTFSMRLGYFPQALGINEKFDVIIFNDVLEHIPNITEALSSCHRHLNEHGVLVVNLPDSGGIFYRIAKLLSRIGAVDFFKRMWQVGLPSPHVHYFNRTNLTTLLAKHGFDVRQTGHLDAVHLPGLFTRISYAQDDRSYFSRLIIYVAVVLSLPFLQVLPRDILYVMATRTEKVTS